MTDEKRRKGCKDWGFICLEWSAIRQLEQQQYAGWRKTLRAIRSLSRKQSLLLQETLRLSPELFSVKKQCPGVRGGQPGRWRCGAHLPQCRPQGSVAPCPFFTFTPKASLPLHKPLLCTWSSWRYFCSLVSIGLAKKFRFFHKTKNTFFIFTNILYLLFFSDQC